MLNLLDLLTTNYGLSRGLTEANPLFTEAAIPGKLIACGIFFAISYLQERWHARTKKFLDIVLIILISLYIYVVINNIVAIILIG
jgi:hypothetical protein